MSEPKWRVLVDWNGGGDFDGEHDDITTAVTALSLAHMRNLTSGYMQPAKLELRLRNHAHRYSPSNATSPLHGLLKPGRKVWLRAAFPCDKFDGDAGASLSGRAPTHGGAYRWASTQPGFTIAAGGGAQTAAGAPGRRTAVMDMGQPAASFGCCYERGNHTAKHGGLLFRYTDADNYLYLRITPAAVEIRKMEDGSDAQLASAPLQWDAGERRFVHVTQHGDDIVMFVDRQRILSAQSAFNGTAARIGLYADDAADHRWHDFGGWVSLFYGDVDAIDPEPQRRSQVCRILASDEMRRMESVTLYMYVSSGFPQRSGIILAKMLDYAGVDASARIIDADGAALVPSAWSPPMWGVNALSEIRRLQDEEDGFVYVDGHGQWRMESRSHRDFAPHTAPRSTLTDRSGSAPYFSDLEWSDGVRNVENKIFMRIRDATNHGLQDVWTLSETPYFNANETRDFLAESKDYDGIGGVLRMRPGMGYRASTQAGGGGTDITKQVSVSLPDTITYSGKGTLIRVRFGSTAGYLTLLRLRSFNAMKWNAPALLTAQDAQSEAAYGRRIKHVEARWTRQAHIAGATLAHRLGRKAHPRTALSVEMRSGSDANLLLMLQAAVSDRIAMRYPAMGIDAPFFVEGHSLAVSGGRKNFSRTLLLQQA